MLILLYFTVKESFKLSKGALPNSVFSGSGNAIYYVDQETGSINKASKAGIAIAWQLDATDDGGLNDVRVLQVTAP